MKEILENVDLPPDFGRPNDPTVPAIVKEGVIIVPGAQPVAFKGWDRVVFRYDEVTELLYKGTVIPAPARAHIIGGEFAVLRDGQWQVYPNSEIVLADHQAAWFWVGYAEFLGLDPRELWPR